MGRGAPPSFTREAVVERAMEVFWREGFHGASIAQLGAAMGLRPGSIYAAFGSKEGLFREALAAYTRQVRARARAPAARPARAARAVVYAAHRPRARRGGRPRLPAPQLRRRAAAARRRDGRGRPRRFRRARAALSPLRRQRASADAAPGRTEPDRDRAAARGGAHRHRRHEPRRRPATDPARGGPRGARPGLIGTMRQVPNAAHVARKTASDRRCAAQGRRAERSETSRRGRSTARRRVAPREPTRGRSAALRKAHEPGAFGRRSAVTDG